MQYLIQQNSEPRSGSDFAIVLRRPDLEKEMIVATVLDTIGHPKGSKLGRFIPKIEKRLKTALFDDSVTDLSTLRQAVHLAIRDINREINEMHKRVDVSIFGYCMSMVLICGNEYHPLWLGDCRTYHIQENQQQTSVRCLTDDQNMLNETLRNRELDEDQTNDYTFFRNEMLQLSRTLICHWGAPPETDIFDRLESEQEIFTLAPDDTILLITDGLYLPALRRLLELTNFKLNREQFYLQDWFERFFSDGRYGLSGSSKDWKTLIPDLFGEARKYSHKKNRYKDDKACIAIRAQEAS